MRPDEVITLDGPSASGKSTVARRLAQALGIPYLSSGLLYRAAALLALEEGLPLEEEPLLERLERSRVQLVPDPGGNRVLVDGQDRTEALHTPQVDRVVSQVARLPRVRDWVNRRLKEVPPPFVAEGRDMGRAVFPGARYKFYLTASPEVRARRRSGERPQAFEEVLQDLLLRDALDQAQSLPAPDALVLDTSQMTVEEVVAWILERIRD
ncbi:(d)CMP kinase [Thermus filiformis]|uniref:Cytidylate kinase n=1 Tax=Thermus filiformis TaxID=276 RepID=A0A0A2WLQ2_THEFI|nr:(d)CMP kinase [Thermus filiformis]KGQ21121.1 cytidylate kinase [Thermus filiformis]